MSKAKKLRITGKWKHPGGKLLYKGPETLTESELLSIIISSGTPKKSAVEIAQEIINRFQSFRGIADLPMEELMAIKGLGQVKVCRIAAVFEIARRIVNYVVKKIDEK